VPTPKAFNFKLHPSHAGVLTQLGLSYVSLGNNHVLDYEQAGLLETHEVRATHDAIQCVCVIQDRCNMLGLSYVSLANNHVLEYEQAGLLETHEVCTCNRTLS
jgi:poly-gamma-glutamate capsule biosynthesis protein CapA/YwtB (metallophosphatase superfamily)